MRGGSTGSFGERAFDERAAAASAYSELIDGLGMPGLRAEAERVAAELSQRGVVFGGSDPRPFDVDVIPRILHEADWAPIEAGVTQRVTALNAFISDVYGERRILSAGVVPERLIESADSYEPAMAGGGVAVAAEVAGPDLVRDPAGEFRVLEDNLRAPSGLAYLLAARAALQSTAAACGFEPRSLEPALAALAAAIRGNAPAGVEEPFAVLLSDGPGASAGYEHRALASRIGMMIATIADLRRSGESLMFGDRRVDVIYRRVDDERLTAADGSPTRLGDLLTGPLHAGTLGCVNSPGTGIADDKAIHVYVEEMIRFYLGEEPVLRSVRGYDLGDPEQLEAALPRLAELVIKPRSDFGGEGVLIGPLATRAEVEAASERVRRTPRRFVAQEPVPLSVHPTLTPGGLAKRHVDLRPFVVSGGGSMTVAAGGLTRFARAEGEMVVNSGRGGGAKDTWVL
jgi:uncharacterized circularly permuted ATP-grasp superfamily protein